MADSLLSQVQFDMKKSIIKSFALTQALGSNRPPIAVHQ